jgi:L-alanine-DL-glutamate epimerase-like enolase superfamily enzyme
MSRRYDMSNRLRGTGRRDSCLEKRPVWFRMVYSGSGKKEDRLKITDLKTYAVKGRHWPRFPWVFVEVETDEGITGLGESLLYKSSGIREAVHNLGGLIIGENPFEVERLWERMYRFGGAPPAISGIEIALWDIIGQSLGVPIYKLLGGRCRDRVRVYCDGFFRGAEYTPDDYTEKAVAAVKQGFTALKMDIDEPLPSTQELSRAISPAELHLTIDMVEAVRKAVGPDIELAIDAHGAFDVSTAITLGKKMAPYDLLWFEDPVSQGNLAAMAKVAEAIDVPVCTGELLRSRYEFRELFERQAAEIIMPDIAYTGGILEMKKIAAMADTYYIPVAPHNMAGPVATVASLHLCACIPNFLVLEFQLGDVPWRDDIISEPIAIEGGYLKLPEKPGLGIQLNKKEIAKHKVE